MPPFPGSVRKLFKKEAPLPKAGGKLDAFIAFRDGKPVGRIAAIHNPRFNDFYKDQTGFFGFFDFIEDSGVALALKEAALNCLKQQGKTKVIGPFNPTPN